MTTRILLADDQDSVRIGFRLILDAQPDMEVVGEAADGLETLALAHELRPDVVLADVRMPGLDGLEVTRRLAGPDAAAPVRVIVVTTFDLDEYVHGALRHGACGFLLKRSGPTLLVEAVRAAMAGDALISPSVTVRLLRHLRRPAEARGEQPTGVRGEQSAGVRGEQPTEPLTEREREVAELVAQGMTNAEIAAELVISAGTAKTHIANIQRKLAVRNRVGIAAWVWDTRHPGY
ncbi:response regulator transcription factor [Streptomyces hygroscopicus]|uniref:response regulator transcription factor n=1 Tax=Streptomyces hygroscopicus TaxID=1912 RepID=UPI0034058CD7